MQAQHSRVSCLGPTLVQVPQSNVIAFSKETAHCLNTQGNQITEHQISLQQFCRNVTTRNVVCTFPSMDAAWCPDFSSSLFYAQDSCIYCLLYHQISPFNLLSIWKNFLNASTPRFFPYGTPNTSPFLDLSNLFVKVINLYWLLTSIDFGFLVVPISITP